MKHIGLLLAIVLLISISSCISNGASSPTLDQTAPVVSSSIPDKPPSFQGISTDDSSDGATTPTRTSTPGTTSSPEPTLTFTPSVIQSELLELSTDGPWLIFADSSDYLFAADADAASLAPLTTGTEIVRSTLFDVSSSYQLIAAVHSGDPSEDGVFLSVIELPSTQVLYEINLKSCHENIPDCVVDVDANLYSKPIWSPDGRYLAFLGAIYGPSSDLYVYDAEWNSIRQLSSGPNQVGEFFWSPDSQWIVHEEVSAFHGWVVEAVWGASIKGGSVKWLYSPEDNYGQVLLGWVDNDQFIAYEHSWGGDRNLRLVSIQNGVGMTLFPGFFHDPVLSPETGTVSFWPLIGAPNTNIDEPGIYIVSTSSSTPKKIAIDDINVRGWFPNEGYFLTYVPCESVESGYLGFNPSGEVTCLAYIESLRVTSPDKSYAISYGDEIEIYGPEDQYIGSIPELLEGLIIWRPDSKGIFIASQSTLYYLSLPDLALETVYEGIGTDYGSTTSYFFSGFLWIVKE